MPNKIFIRPLFQFQAEKEEEESTAEEGSALGGAGVSLSGSKLNPKTLSDDDVKAMMQKEVKVKGGDVMVYPLTEDITFTVQSDLQSWSEMVPGIELLGKVQTVMSAGSGRVSGGILNLQNMFDAPRWEKTMPLEFNVNLGFYTVDDPLKNVFLPMKRLIGMTVLSRDRNGRITPPGLYLPSAAAAKVSKTPSAGLVTSAKLISLKIPGIIFMKYAMIKQATPVFSKHLTSAGLPLWGTLELNIVGLTPMFEEDFNGDIYRAPTTEWSAVTELASSLGVGL